MVDFSPTPINEAVRLVNTKLPSPMAAPPFGRDGSGMLRIWIPVSASIAVSFGIAKSIVYVSLSAIASTFRLPLSWIAMGDFDLALADSGLVDCHWMGSRKESAQDCCSGLRVSSGVDRANSTFESSFPVAACSRRCSCVNHSRVGLSSVRSASLV